jgi:rod shape-determining protein MreB
MELSSNYCLDFGSANIRIGAFKSGVLLTEASCAVTFMSEDGERSIVALGNSALEMYGRLPKVLQHSYLVKDGSLVDVESMIELVRQLFIQVQERLLWANQQVTICHSALMNSEERNGFIHLMKMAGVRRVRFVPRVLAIATALELDIQEPQGRCIIDVGAHLTEIGLISCGVVVKSAVLKIGGDTFSQSLVRYLRQKYAIEISIRQADKLKELYGACTVHPDGVEQIEVRGRSLSDNFPTLLYLSHAELCKGLQAGLNMWLTAVSEFFEEVPIELSTDIVQTGVYLVGGGSQLEGFDWTLSQRVKFMVFMPDNPAELCITGAGQKI